MFKNTWTGLGNTGSEPTTRKVGEKEVTSVRLAVSNGKGRDATWLTIEAWGPLSARLASVKKGEKIGICGRLAPETYTDKDGVKQTVVKIVASDIAYLTPKAGGAAEEEEEDLSAY